MSSSYDSALIDTAMIDDPRLLRLPRSIRLFHLEALVWSKLHRSDGFVPTGAVGRMTDEPDPQFAAGELVRVELWHVAPDGWQIVRFTDTQMSAARVEAKRAAAKERYDRWSSATKRVGNAMGNGPGNGSARPPAPPARQGRGQKGGGNAKVIPATVTGDWTFDNEKGEAYFTPIPPVEADAPGLSNNGQTG